MRAIDADALRAKYQAILDRGDMFCEYDIVGMVDNAPTVVAENATSDRPHGEWIEHYDCSDGFTWLTCSRCMFKAYEDDYNFCPNCGADMRGGRE